MKKTNLNNSLSLKGLLKGLILAIFTTLVCILIFAFILNIFNMGNESIDIVNQIIKIMSIILGCIYLQKSSRGAGIVNYILLPFSYTIITFIIFSALNGSFYLDITLFNDVFFSVVIGIIYYLILGRNGARYTKKVRR